MSRIVVSVLPTTAEGGLEAVRRAQRAGAQLVELRLDYFRDCAEVERLVRESPAPVLAACRVPDDGGFFAGTKDQRRDLLAAAARAGAEWVDLEHWETMELPPGLPARVLRSFHRLAGPPRDLVRIVDRMAKRDPAALKVTLAGYDAADIALLHAVYERRYPMPLVAFLAGSAVRASRYLALLRGAPFLYCAAGPGRETAPGQPDLFEALQLYRAGDLGLDSRFWGLLGAPVDHSLGFRLHNGLKRFLRDAPAYLPFETKEPGRLIEELRRFGARFLGLSVTAPLKRKVLPLLDELGPEAEACGAVNTIIHRDGQLRGENSDVAGVRCALREALPRGRELGGCRAVVIGGGGSARAAAIALLGQGARVCLAVRSRQHIRDFAAQRDIPLFPIAAKTFRLLVPDVIVHATPVGQATAGEASEACLLDVADIPGNAVVLDLVYRPTWTELLRRTAVAGATPVSGMTMFLHQAIEQLRWVLGVTETLPSTAAMTLLLGPAGRALRAGAPRI